MIRLITLLALLGCLSACGFRPLYAGQTGSNAASAHNITIQPIPGRSGYNLRQALLRELSPGLPGLDGAAHLTISLNERIARATLLPDGAVSRSFINARGQYTLETDNGPIRGDASVQVPFAATATPYSDVSAQTYAAERAMAELSRQIVEQLRIQVQGQQDQDAS
ncbi:LPS assembly lipoprotein LptE [Henriciella aquimarina]|uniref:LPS assembly lipoprotein LptE n=1 Tax=Henriciella aquimarina TaxID=545261 RepID=UPI000A0264F7|nr:LPS assembly lipoprotein LptE [Henriciella aquimarina]